MKKMTPRERVFARLEGKPVDRIPNLNIIMQFSAWQSGKRYREYVSDFRVLTACDLAASEKFGIDLLCAISDPMREAEGFGAEVVLPEDGVPYSPVPLLCEFAQAKDLKAIRPEESARMADRIAAVEEFRRLAGEEYAVCGWVEGAFAECCDLREISEFLMDVMVEDPDEIHALLHIVNEQAIAFALAQVRAGADMIGIGDAACSLLSPDLYRRFALPYEKRLIEEIHRAGARTKLHICGNTTALLPDLATTGTDIFDVDWMVDLKAAVRAFEPVGILISGNYDPVSVLLQGTPDGISERVRACAEIYGNRGFCAAGCEVPPATPAENLLAVRKTLESLAESGRIF